MTITKLDGPAMQHLRIEINAALEDVADKYGLQIKTGSARYSATEGNFKVRVNTIVNGIVETAERTRFVSLATHYGLKPGWLDQEFMHQGDKYKIVGLNTRARQYPVQVKRIHDGTNYKFPIKLVAECMKRMPVTP